MHSGVLFHFKEYTYVVCREVDGMGELYVKRSKPSSKS
jgi:hypothetical protein